MKILFCSTQGCLVQKDGLFDERQGFGTENGGQLGYELRMAEELAKRGHEVVILKRWYHRDGASGAGDILVEDHPSQPGVSLVHIATSANDNVLKEHFYPYYKEFLAYAMEHFKSTAMDFDAGFGHYIDGIAQVTYLSDFFEEETGKPMPRIAVWHSMADGKIADMGRDVLKKCEGASTTTLAKLLGDFNIAVSQDLNFQSRRELERLLSYQQDGAIVISADQEEILYDCHGFEGKISRIPGGFNPEVFYPLPKSNHDLKTEGRLALMEKYPEFAQAFNPENKLIVGWGRFLEEKGIHVAATAMDSILKEHPTAFYVYVGGEKDDLKRKEEENAYRNLCLEIAQNGGYSDRIVFPGKMKHPELAVIARHADAVLFPQLLEPYGMGIIEAMASKVPVCFSEVAGARDDFNRNEHYRSVNAQNPMGVAAEVNWVLSNPVRAKLLADQGYRKVMSFATWPGRAAGTESFMTEVIGDLKLIREEFRAAPRDIAHIWRDLSVPLSTQSGIPNLDDAVRIMAKSFARRADAEVGINMEVPSNLLYPSKREIR